MLNRVDDWPSTVEEFAKCFSFAGAFNSSSEKPQVRTRNCSIAYKGKIKMPDIFAKEGVCPSVGDQVGLMVKCFPNHSKGLVGLDGKIESSPTKGPFLQVKGYFEPGS